jgi:hypothetical protein
MAVDVTTLNRVSSALVRFAAAGAAGLVATGVPLLVVYRPKGGTSWLSTLHTVSSMLFLGATAGILLAALAAAVLRGGRTWLGWPLAMAAFAVAAAGAVSGPFLSWDGIGLASVRVGRDLRGVIPPFFDDVRFFVVGDAELSPRAFLAWLIVHAALLPLAAVAVWRAARPRLHAWLRTEDVAAGADQEGSAGERA